MTAKLFPMIKILKYIGKILLIAIGGVLALFFLFLGILYIENSMIDDSMSPAHQRPQRFQVMVSKPRASIECGSVAVDFHVRSDLARVSTVVVNTPRGHLRVSSPEATAVELIGYAKHAGGLDNVATVLSELAESISPLNLLEEARKAPLAWAQRLGFLLDLVGRSDVADGLLHFVGDRARRVAPLDAGSSRTGARRSERWRVAVNVDVEPDL